MGGHPGLNKFKSNVGVRTKTAISFIPRNNFLNNTLGKLGRKKMASSDGWTVYQMYKSQNQDQGQKKTQMVTPAHPCACDISDSIHVNANERK